MWEQQQFIMWFALTLYCYDRLSKHRLLAIRCQHLSLCAYKSLYFEVISFSWFTCCLEVKENL